MNALPSISVIDNFCPVVDQVKASAFASGFGKWEPNAGLIGNSKYSGMNFQGWHAPMVHSLTTAIGGKQVYPNALFFRVTTKDTEKAYTHSDREYGSWSCVAYLTEHKEVSGTGFYRHRKTGLVEMPPFSELQKPKWAKLRRDIVDGGEKEWEQTAFVSAIYNRAIIFSAKLFHARCPKNGFGTTEKTGRVVWVFHGEIAS